MTANGDGDRQQVRYADQQVFRTPGGETHQRADGAGNAADDAAGRPGQRRPEHAPGGRARPGLLEDFHFREKIIHFDHERIPERVVHARGYGAHGYFENYEPLADITRADLFSEPASSTPVFVRFSTVAGNKGRLTWPATSAASPSSSTPGRATGTWSATTSRSSSSRTRSSSPT